MATAASTINMSPATPLDSFKPVGKKELGRTDFMTLFITQLQYQDPLKPMDSYEMASQLAQFSNMEATMKMSDNMEKLLEYQISQNNLQLLTLLGTTVQTFGNEVGVSGGVPSETEFTLATRTDSCQIEIYDAAERLVRTINKGAQIAGTYALAWDGKDSAGKTVADGVYRYAIKAVDDKGQKVDVDYRTTGKVTGLEFESGRAMVKVDNFIDVAVRDIVRVLGLAAGNATDTATSTGTGAGTDSADTTTSTDRTTSTDTATGSDQEYN
jgi:flagellar basal-body rod modification protein FlgD